MLCISEGDTCMQNTAKAPTSMAATRRRENIAGYLFMLPSLLFFLGFVIFPMGMCLVTSFFNYTMTEFTFTGLANYKELIADPIFQKALVNTIVIVVTSVPITCIFSLWVASVIYKMHDRYTSLFRCIFYLPVVTGSVAVTVVWKWMFSPYTGVLNYVFKNLGIISKNINWLGSPEYALGCIILILLTTSVGQPIVLYILVITTINSFQCFALIQLLTSGGPNNSTQTIMYYIYYNAFKLSRYGYGSAMGIILAIIIALFSALQFKLAKSDNG